MPGRQKTESLVLIPLCLAFPSKQKFLEEQVILTVLTSLPPHHSSFTKIWVLHLSFETAFAQAIQ